MTDFFSYLLAGINQERLERQAKQGGITLGELSTLLAALPANTVLKNASSIVSSYRGYYEDLAVEPGETTAGELHAVLELTVGTTLEGYKGGDYVMSRTTRVWLSHYGSASGLLITGVVAYGDGTAALETVEEEW